MKYLVLLFLFTFAALGYEPNLEFIESCGKDHSELPPPANELDPDAALVAGIFQSKCVSCHRPGNPSGPFIDIMDVDEMMAKNIIDPIDPEQSKLYKSLNRVAGWMPKGGEILPISEKSQIIKWMGKSNPPPSLKDPGPGSDLPIIDYESEVACIFFDIIRAVDINDREFTRYLTLSNYSNLQKVDEFKQQTEAVQKLLNSISYNARLTKAGKVDKYGVIYRFDLRDFNLVAADFDNLVAVGQYPYFLARFDSDEVEFYEDAIEEFTKTKTIAFIRSDFFVFTASTNATIYYDLLKIPKKKADLLALLGVDQADQFEDEDAKRTGIRNSAVTNFPRVVDRYELEIGIGPFQYDGQLWTTYDFDNNDLVTSSIFANPFGPDNEDIFDNVLVTNKKFIHQAEEHIFSLPNGLSAYAVFSGDGIRLDAAAAAVAIDPGNVGPGHLGAFPTEILVAASCMHCHYSGMNLYSDILRDFVQYSIGFNSEEADFARDNFFPQQDLRTELLRYVGDFSTAQTAVGVAGQVALNNEPIFHQALYYNDTVDPCELAAEFYIDCKDAKQRLARDPQLAIELGYGADITGQAPRDTIEDRFGDIAVSFNIGEQILFDLNEAPKCELVSDKKVVFQGNIAKFIIEVIGEADFVKINGKFVSGNSLNIRLNKLGVNRIEGFVSNKFGSFKCFAEVLVKKKNIGKAPTCKINTDKDEYWNTGSAKVTISHTESPTWNSFQGTANAGYSHNFSLKDILGRFRFFASVRNKYGEGQCEKWVNVKQKILCDTQVTNRSLWYTKFDLKNTRTKKRIFGELRRLDVLQGYKVRSNDAFQYLGEFWDGKQGYWFQRIYNLKACGKYKLVTYDGRQVVMKE